MDELRAATMSLGDRELVHLLGVMAREFLDQRGAGRAALSRWSAAVVGLLADEYVNRVDLEDAARLAIDGPDAS